MCREKYCLTTEPFEQLEVLLSIEALVAEDSGESGPGLSTSLPSTIY
jgi:hypothetical protein